MTIVAQRVDTDKIVEAIIFVASKVPQPTLHKISKMFWFADKLHLERYGFALSDDTYHAMPDGPVPSKIYDILKLAKKEKQFVTGVNTDSVRSALAVLDDGRTVQVKRSADTDYLSEAEIECLVEAMETHGHKSFKQLSDETHDSAWRSVARNSPIPLREIVKTLPNAEALENFLCA